MNLLDLKRKALGWLTRGLGSDTEGGADTGVGGSGTAPGDPAAGGGANLGGNYGGKDSDGNSIGSGWTGNRSERDARGAGNDKAGNANGGPAGNSDYSDRVASNIDGLISANPDANINREKAISDTLTRDPISKDGEVSDNGWTYGELESLSKQGFGSLSGVNANNMTGQTVDNALASKNFNDNIAPAVVGAITAAVPGAGLAMSGMRAAGRVSSGQSTLGDEAKNFAIDYAGNKVAGMINSQLADVVGRDAYGALGTASSVSKAVGGPGMPNVGASVVNGVLGAAGVTKSTGAGFSSQNNPAADNGFTAPGTNYSGGGLIGGTTPVATPVTPTAASVAAESMQGADINLWGGMDGAGWTAAKDKYFSSKGN